MKNKNNKKKKMIHEISTMYNKQMIIQFVSFILILSFLNKSLAKSRSRMVCFETFHKMHIDSNDRHDIAVKV